MSREITEYGNVIGLEGTELGEVDMVAMGQLEGTDPNEWGPDDREMVEAAFSLVCRDCDDEHRSSRSQANMDGWTGIFFDPAGSSWNYQGLCPECAKAEAHHVP